MFKAEHRNTGWGIILMIVAFTLASCGGGGSTVAGLDPAGHVADGSGVKSAGVLITEAEIATCPIWQREKLSDTGWNQPYIAPDDSTALVEPTGDMLLEYTRLARERGLMIEPRNTAARTASWMDFDPPMEGDPVLGEYDGVAPTAVPPFGCNSDGGNEINGNAVEDVIAQYTVGENVALSYVLNGLSSPNWFNRSGGAGNDAMSVVFQLIGTSSDPFAGEETEFFELSYRADLAPGIGPGGDCSAAEAYLVSGLIWKRYNSTFNALPNLDEVYTYDVLIAPKGNATDAVISSGNTTGRIQDFHFGGVYDCFNGGVIVSLESSSSGCAEFDTSVVTAYSEDSPWFTSPIYGVLMERWRQMELVDMAGPWEGELGWPVFGPVAHSNGAQFMSRKGAYYMWGIWFERGFMAWLDYDQESYPETPDEVQVWRFTGSNVYCPETGDYERIKPNIKYGGSSPWPAPLGQPRVAVSVEGYRGNPTHDWNHPRQTDQGEYLIGLANGGMTSAELSLRAQAWGGTPNADCSYDYYVWAFRDGTIFMGDEASAKTVTHTYGSTERNLESTYIVRVQVTDSTGAVGYGDSYPITFGHGGTAMVTPSIWVIRNDDNNYTTSYDALINDLNQLQAYYTELGYSSTVAEDFNSCNIAKVAIWYRGGPATEAEALVPPRTWTTEEIDNFQQLLMDEGKVLLVSQDHGYNSELYPGYGWGGWYGWDENELPQSIPQGEERFLWALGMTEAYGVSVTGQYGYLKVSPRNLPTYGSINSILIGDGYQGGLGAEYTRAMIPAVSSPGDIPLTISFGQPERMVGHGYSAALTSGKMAPGFVSGLMLDMPFEGSSHLACVSGGCRFSPHLDVGLWPGPYDFSRRGTGQVWWIGYPWATTEVTQSMSGLMVGAENRYMLLNNILSWLDSDYFYGSHFGGFNEYDGHPEIIQVNIGTWQPGGYDYGAASMTWNGSTGDYPDQTMANPYVSSDTFGGDYIVTSSRNNDWKNGNDIDFSFPWYAYITDVNGDGVQMEYESGSDDTVFFGGLLLDDPGDAWERDLTLNYYGQAELPHENVPSVVMDDFDPPVVVAGYYVSTTGDVGGEVRASYGTAAASAVIDNAEVVSAECIAHWPVSLQYGGIFLPGGNYFPKTDPALYWSMFPGQHMRIPDAYNDEGVSRIEDTWMGWDSYRWMFDVDPSVSRPARDGATDWNNPLFTVTDRISEGRIITCDYGAIPRWNPDLNRDGDDNSAGVNDYEDKFPIRVRLITEYSDYVQWDDAWPNHLPDPGIDPALGGPRWYDDEQIPPMYFKDWPDYLEGGVYIVDAGDPRYPIPPPLSAYGTPPHLTIEGDSGDYTLTLNYLIAFGNPVYTLDINIGYEESTGDPVASFGQHGLVHYSAATHSTNGPQSHAVNVSDAPGLLPEYTDLYVAIRVTDSSVPWETHVYVWETPIQFIPQGSFD